MDFQNVWRAEQWGYGEGAGNVPMYTFTAPARLVAERALIDRRSPSKKDGYQRELSPVRLGNGKLGVAGYVLNQMGVFPTSVLVNVRKDKWNLKFSPSSTVSKKIQVGKLMIPEDAEWFIIDGQHRIEGLKLAMKEKAELENYPVMITMTNEESLQEMLIFYLVNSRARSVPTDLSYRILQRMYLDEDAPEWVEYTILAGADRRKAMASTIVDFLNVKPESPFRGRIQEVGEQEKGQHLTTDGTLTRYLAMILSEKIFENMDEEIVADLLASYWSAVRDVYPKAFNDSNGYALVTTLGLSSMSRLFSTIYGYAAGDKDTSSASMKKYVKLLLEDTKEHKDIDFQKPITEKWWNFTDGPGIIKTTGEGSFSRIADNLAMKISLVLKKRRKA